jgi:hypothetical protein
MRYYKKLYSSKANAKAALKRIFTSDNLLSETVAECRDLKIGGNVNNENGKYGVFIWSACFVEWYLKYFFHAGYEEVKKVGSCNISLRYSHFMPKSN